MLLLRRAVRKARNGTDRAGELPQQNYTCPALKLPEVDAIIAAADQRRVVRSLERYDFDVGGPIYDDRPIKAVDVGNVDMACTSAALSAGRDRSPAGGAGETRALLARYGYPLDL